MSEDALRDLTRAYYQSWAKQDRARVETYLTEELDFRSPQDRFAGAREFLDACWHYSAGLARVRFIKELYSGDEAFVVLEWEMEDGSRFTGAEYLRAKADRIREIIVVNNDPSFGEVIRQPD